MLSAISLIVRISLFRANPQELPASPALLAFAGGLCLLSALPQGGDPAYAALLALGQLVVLAVLVAYALRRRGFPERATQVLSALFGALAVINLATRPVLAWMEAVEGHALWTPMLIGMCMLLWMTAVMAHILYQALDTPPGMAAALSILMLGVVLAATIVLLSLRAWMLDA